MSFSDPVLTTDRILGGWTKVPSYSINNFVLVPTNQLLLELTRVLPSLREDLGVNFNLLTHLASSCPRPLDGT